MIADPSDRMLEKWGRAAIAIEPSAPSAKAPEEITRDRKREENRLREIAAANGDRIVKSRIDGSYHLVDAATNTLIWPAHVGTTRIGATFNELRDRILEVSI